MKYIITREGAMGEDDKLIAREGEYCMIPVEAGIAVFLKSKNNEVMQFTIKEEVKPLAKKKVGKGKKKSL